MQSKLPWTSSRKVLHHVELESPSHSKLVDLLVAQNRRPQVRVFKIVVGYGVLNSINVLKHGLQEEDREKVMKGLVLYIGGVQMWVTDRVNPNEVFLLGKVEDGENPTKYRMGVTLYVSDELED